jgi:hypothetical protein
MTDTKPTASKAIKQGQKPVSQKPDLREFLRSQDTYEGQLAFPKKVVKFAEKYGLRLCWRNKALVDRSGGADPAGYILFRRDLLQKDPEFTGSDTIDSVEFQFGGHSDAYYMRGDLILGYIPSEDWQKKQKANQERAHNNSRVAKSAENIAKAIGSKAVKIKTITEEE